MFRGSDPEAIWSQDDMEIATWAYYSRDPSGWWRWFFERFAGIVEARPNRAHEALAAMERFKKARGNSFLLVTQNIDTLHEQAGSRNLVKIHGNSDRVRCTRTGCGRAAPSGSIPLAELDLSRFGSGMTETVPRCPECDAIIRPHVLLFDEYYIEHHDYGFAPSLHAIQTADLLLFVGTSFSVGVTELALESAWRTSTPVISVDPAGNAPRGSIALCSNAEDVLPEIVARLEQDP